MEFWLELTPECNINCEFCYNAWSLERKPASIEGFKSRLVCFLKNFPGSRIVHAGGEPLLFDGLLGLAEELSMDRFQQSVVTNGVLLTQEMVDGLIGCGIYSVSVSVHSAHEEEHNLLTRSSSWQEAVTGLIRAASSGMRVAITAVVCRENCQRLHDIYRLAVYVGASEIILNRYISAGRGRRVKGRLQISEEAFEAAVRSMLAIADGRVKVRLGVPTISPSKLLLGVNACGSCPVSTQQKKFVVDFYGRVRRCTSSENSIGMMDDPCVVEKVRSGAFDSAWANEQFGWRKCVFFPDK